MDVYSSLCAHLYMDKPVGTLILTNESLRRINRLIRVNQSQAHKLDMDTDRQTEKVTYSTSFFHKGMDLERSPRIRGAYPPKSLFDLNKDF
jgi:hypothetical protein